MIDTDKLLAAMKEHDTGCWDHEAVDACLTSKNADLKPSGQQGISVEAVTDATVKCLAHIGETLVGLDACLNLTPEQETDADFFCEAKETYLEQAQEVVCGCGVFGEWDGDNWCLYETVPFEVPVVMADDGTPDYDATAQRIVEAGEQALAPLQLEIELADELLDMLAGWKEHDPTTGMTRHCEEGKPGARAAWL